MEVKSAQDATTLEMEVWVNLNLSEAEDLTLDVFFLLQTPEFLFSFLSFLLCCSDRRERKSGSIRSIVHVLIKYTQIEHTVFSDEERKIFMQYSSENSY